MPKPTVIDTLNDALGLTGDEPGTNADGSQVDEGAAEGEEHAEEGLEEEPAEEEGEEEPGEEEGADEDGAEGEGEEDSDTHPDDPLRRKDGTFKSEPKKEEKPGEKPGDARKLDPINDPIPKGLNQETRERMVSLVRTAKELTTERDEARSNFGTFVGGLQAANVTPDQYGEWLNWQGMFNGNTAQREKALEAIETLATNLAMSLGKERKFGDPLAGHADLVTAVQQNKITKEYAAEIARTRNQQGFNRRIQETANSQQQQRDAATQELGTARTDLSTLEDTLRQTDPDYERKKAILVPALKPIMKSLPPKEWKAKFLESYNSIKLGRMPVQGNGKKKNGGVPKNQPLRAGKQPAGGQVKQAGSALDAMSAALANIGKHW
jgi:hypothetical protein